MALKLETHAETATPGATPSAPSAPRAGRGVSYAEGRAQLSPQASGSAMVAGSCQTTEEAYNAGLTAQLLTSLQRAPDANLDDAVAHARTAVNRLHPDQNASLTTVGNHRARAKGGGKKRAVYLANARYADAKTFGPLDSTVNEAQALQTSLGSRGYESQGIHQNQTAAQMKQLAATTALGGRVQEGDHVVVHYGGHGLTSGLVGVNLDGQVRVRQDAIEESAIPGDTNRDLKAAPASLQGRAPKPGLDPNDVLPYTTLDAIARSAVSKGVHVSLILDACHSGGVADLARTQRDLAPGGTSTETTGPTASTAPIASAPEAGAALATGTKQALVGIQLAWKADAMAARQEGNAGAAAREAEVDTRYLAALQQLWAEFVAARLASIESELKARSRYMGAAPPSPTGPKAFGAVLAWLDQASDALAAP